MTNADRFMVWARNASEHGTHLNLDLLFGLCGGNVQDVMRIEIDELEEFKIKDDQYKSFGPEMSEGDKGFSLLRESHTGEGLYIVSLERPIQYLDNASFNLKLNKIANNRKNKVDLEEFYAVALRETS